MEIAHRTNRVLIIHTDDTFPIHKFFDPGSSNVRFESGKVKWSALQSKVHISNDYKNNSFLKLLNTGSKHIFADTNMDYLPELFPGESEDQLNGRRAILFNQIFHLKPFFQKEVDANTPQNPIAIHTRFTGILGDFKDVIHRPLDEVRRKALIDLCCKQALDILDQYPQHSVILFSDSVSFLDACCAKSPRIVRISGTPLHIDHTVDHDNALYKTLLDFFVMMKCDPIYLLVNKPMYNSNFSRYAAIFGNKKFIIQSANKK